MSRAARLRFARHSRRLDVDQLKDVVAQHQMDRAKLAMKWRTPERLIDLIVTQTISGHGRATLSGERGRRECPPAVLLVQLMPDYTPLPPDFEYRAEDDVVALGRARDLVLTLLGTPDEPDRRTEFVNLINVKLKIAELNTPAADQSICLIAGLASIACTLAQTVEVVPEQRLTAREAIRTCASVPR